MTGLISRVSITLGLAVIVFACAAAVAAEGNPTPAPGEAAVALNAWADTLAIDPRVIREIDRYAESEGGKFRDGYAGELSAAVRRLVFSAVSKALANPPSRSGEPLVEVTYMEPGFSGEAMGEGGSSLEAKFEKSIIRTEFVTFIEGPDISPEEALKIYTDPAFRMSLSSRINRIWIDQGLDCVETDGVRFVVPAILYCSRLDELHDSTMAAQHSQVVTNDDKYQTAYFKESLKTFVKVPGGIVFHYINFFRGIDLGSVGKKLGRGKIIESEMRAIEELGSRLSGRTRPGD